MRKVILSLFLIIFISSFSQPEFIWAKEFASDSMYHGGAWSSSITTDSRNNVYTVGQLYGTVDFDPGPEKYLLSTPTGSGGNQVFISKLDSNGNFIWAKQFSGSMYIFANDIKTDSENNVYVCGYFNNTVDFDPGPATFYITATHYSDWFVSKLDSQGNFIWAIRIGGQNLQKAESLTIDKHDNIYCAGNSEGELIVCKLSSDGQIKWKRKVGNGYGAKIISSNSNLYLSYCNVIGIMKLDSLGNVLWNKAVQSGYSSARDVATDESGNVYVTGEFNVKTDFDFSSGDFFLETSGSNNAFVLKLSSAGDFMYAKKIGGNSFCYGYAIKYFNNNIYVSGAFAGEVDFDPGQESYLHNSFNYWADAFIVQLTASDGSFNCAGVLGGYGSDYASAMNLTMQGEIILSGSSLEGDFDPGPDTFFLKSPNVFTVKLKSCIDKISAIVESKIKADQIIIFPNPVCDKLTISEKKFSDQTIAEVLDINARQVYKSILTGDHSTLEISQLPSGIYILSVLTADRRYVARFVKE